ncbi:DEAD/DEAH box helicase [Engelhardtia mirabilis]|uniref:DEAD/DEAH box helicase n=1 Tax=Engelhardtia mirabilis TaxID=2528011 RepID=UPI003AF36C3C
MWGADPGRSPANSAATHSETVISRRTSSARPATTRGPAAPDQPAAPEGRPAASFDSLDLSPELSKAVTAAGFTELRPIQAHALPHALAGRDVLGLAQTGTGKTAAFALPILQRLLGRRANAPRALVVAPTRELAAQVQAEIALLAKFTPLTSMSIFGGVPIPRQVRALRSNPDIVVACPGRLLDLMGQGAIKLNCVEVLVLDEADHMFDMGFLPDVRRILKALPERRQNLLFSATMPREIRKLADTVLFKPAVVELANARPAETIAHSIYQMTEGDKVGATEALLEGDDFRSAIVFLRTKRRAKKLAERLDARGHRAVAMQGNMSQPQRERALRGFRDGTFDVLVATDIAARGLDIAGVSHVINFDVPNTPDAYTHRIGRTGRSEQTGQAFTFVTAEDHDQVRQIEKRLGAPIDKRKLSELGHIEKATLKGATGRGRSSDDGGSSRGSSGRGGPGRGGPSRGAAPRGRSTRAAGPSAPPARAPARKVSSTAKVSNAPAAASRGGPAFGVGVHESSGGGQRRQDGGGGQRPPRRRRGA